MADAQAALAEARLVAPFAGVIDEVRVVPEDVVAPGTTLVTMVDTSSLRILARINEIDLDRLETGKNVQLTFDALRNRQPLSGRIGEIPPFGTYQSGVTIFDVPIEFEPGNLSLKLGMTVNVSIPVNRHENVLTLPTSAIQTDEHGTFVFLAQGKEVERRPVRVGVSDGITTEIVDGLAEGDVVRVPIQAPVGPAPSTGGK